MTDSMMSAIVGSLIGSLVGFITLLLVENFKFKKENNRKEFEAQKQCFTSICKHNFLGNIPPTKEWEEAFNSIVHLFDKNEKVLACREELYNCLNKPSTLWDENANSNALSKLISTMAYSFGVSDYDTINRMKQVYVARVNVEREINKDNAFKAIAIIAKGQQELLHLVKTHNTTPSNPLTTTKDEYRPINRQ